MDHNITVCSINRHQDRVKTRQKAWAQLALNTEGRTILEITADTYEAIADTRIPLPEATLQIRFMDAENTEWKGTVAAFKDQLYKENVKKFPNGFTSWMEAHHEVVEFISLWIIKNEEIYPLGGGHQYSESDPIMWHRQGGQHCVYELAETWTDEFEAAHVNTEWDVDPQSYSFYEEIESFLLEKANPTKQG